MERVSDDMESGKSAVDGSKWKRLSRAYAEKEKGGDTLSDLHLTGDMQSSIMYETYRDGIEFGIFDSEEAAKADGHCNYSGLSKLPLRRFIPNEDYDFRPGIKNAIRLVVQEYVDEVELGKD